MRDLHTETQGYVNSIGTNNNTNSILLLLK